MIEFKKIILFWVLFFVLFLYSGIFYGGVGIGFYCVFVFLGGVVGEC